MNREELMNGKYAVEVSTYEEAIEFNSILGKKYDVWYGRCLYRSISKDHSYGLRANAIKDGYTIITFEEFKQAWEGEEVVEQGLLSDIGSHVKEALVEYTLGMDGFDDVVYVPEKYFEDIVDYVLKRVQPYAEAIDKPKYKAFDVLPEEYIGREIKTKGAEDYWFVVKSSGMLLIVGDTKVARFLKEEDLFEDYENLDGTPIGEKV